MALCATLQGRGIKGAMPQETLYIIISKKQYKDFGREIQRVGVQ